MTDRTADRQVLGLLRQHGSDMTQPHHTIHYFYFPSEQAARSAEAQLRSAGMEEVEIEPAPAPWWKKLFGKRDWVCIAETHAVPSEENVFATSDRFNALASQCGGTYDGWEAGIVPKS